MKRNPEHEGAEDAIEHQGYPEDSHWNSDDPPEEEDGFTLIELLVVCAIIAILAAIAIPQYATYKQQALDAAAKSDLHNMATAMEAYYGSNNNTYSGTSVDTLKQFGFRQSSSVIDSITTANQTAYSLTANPPGGSGVWQFDSNSGVITKVGS